MPTNDISKLMEVLRLDDHFECVTVNSTLAKHYVSESERLSLTQTVEASATQLIGGRDRGRALILCNTTDREGWEVQYNDAVFILEKQLGLKVFCQ